MKKDIREASIEFIKDFIFLSFTKEKIAKFTNAGIKFANGLHLEKDEIEVLKELDEYFLRTLGRHLFSKYAVACLKNC